MPADATPRSSRPRCWDRAGRVGVRADGSLGPVDGSSQVVVIDGAVRSGVTAGVLARAIRAGVPVTSVAVDTSAVGIDAARAHIRALLADGTLYTHAVAGLSPPMDLTERLTTADVRAVAAFRRTHPLVHGLETATWSDRQVHAYLTATATRHLVAIAADTLDPAVLSHVLASARCPAHAAAEILLASQLGGRDTDLARARTHTLRVGPADVLRSPIRTAASLRFPDLEPDQALAAVLVSRTGDLLPPSATHRDALRVLAGLPTDSDAPAWRDRLATLATEHPDRAATVLCLALHGEVDPTVLEAAFRSAAPPSLPELMRLSPAALATACNGLDDGSIEPADVLTHAATVVSVFKKRTGDYLDLARRMRWSAHDAAASLSVPADGRFAELVLSSRLTTWASPAAARSAIRLVSAEWDGIVAHCPELPTALSAAVTTARGMSRLGPVWVATPFADVVGNIDVGRSVARTAASVWLLSQGSPGIYPHHARYRSEGYTGYFLDRSDPRGLFLGELTDCCQHIGGAGEPCAIDGQMNPTSGFFVVERDGRVVAQSWVWLDETGDGVCFDNIERLDGALDDDAAGSFHTQVRAVYQSAADDLASRWRVTVTVGEGYSDDEFLDGLRPVEPRQPRDYDDYRDSTDQRLFATRPDTPATGPRPVGALAWETVSGEIVTGTRSSHNGRACVDFDAFQPGAAELAGHLAAENPHQVITLDGRVVGAPAELDYGPLVDDVGLAPLIENPDLDARYTTAYITHRQAFTELGVTDDHEALELIRAGSDPDGLSQLLADCRIWGVSTDKAAELILAGVPDSQTLRACLDLGATNLDEAATLARRSTSPQVLRVLTHCTAAKMDPQVLDRGLRIAEHIVGSHLQDLDKYTAASDIDEHTAAAAISAHIPIRHFRDWDRDGVLADELARAAGHHVPPFTGDTELPRWARESPDTIERLADAGIDPRILNIYHLAGVRTLEEACRAADLGYDVRSMYQIAYVGRAHMSDGVLDTDANITPLLAAGVTAAEATRYREFNGSLGRHFHPAFNNWGIAALVEHGITPEYISRVLSDDPDLVPYDLLPYDEDDEDDDEDGDR